MEALDGCGKRVLSLVRESIADKACSSEIGVFESRRMVISSCMLRPAVVALLKKIIFTDEVGKIEAFADCRSSAIVSLRDMGRGSFRLGSKKGQEHLKLKP